MNDSLQFDKGIMRLSAFDPLSNQYETRILTLPELPLLESLEHLFEASNSSSSSSSSRPTLRMTKSCSNKKSTVTKSNSNISISNLPRRCQSNPNLSKKKQQPKQKTVGGPIRSKRSLSSAFNAVAGFIQKATNKKIRSQQWTRDTWVDELKFSTSSTSISSLATTVTATTVTPSSSAYRQNFNSTCENWWISSPPISSY